MQICDVLVAVAFAKTPLFVTFSLILDLRACKRQADERGFFTLEQLQNTPLKSRRGEGPRVYASSFFGGWIIERGNFLCAGYASTRGYASKLRLRVPVFVLFCSVGWIMERGNFLCAGYASKLKLRVPVFVVFCVGAGA